MESNGMMVRTSRLTVRYGGVRLALVLVTALLAALALTTAPAFADFGITSFDGSVNNQSGDPFTQAGGHPYGATTTFYLNKGPDGNAIENPKDIRVDLPPGLVGNPSATPKCTWENFERAVCSPDTVVGQMTLYIGNVGNGQQGPFPLNNIVPRHGQPARFAGTIAQYMVVITPKVRTGSDYGLTMTLSNLSNGWPITGSTVTFYGIPADRNAGHAPRKPFLTLPTACLGPQTTTFAVDTWQHPGDWISASFLSHDNSGNPIGATGCDKPAFDPSITVTPTVSAAASPTGLSVDLRVPQNDDPGGLASANLKDATVALPEGMTVSPSGANGLGACAPAQIDMDGAGPAQCPDDAKIGSVSIETPLLDHPLPGSIYLASQNDNPFRSLLAIYIAVNDPKSGIVVKLAGHVVPDPVTGQLTTTFSDNPQLPFSKMHLQFFGGPRAALATPAACGSKVVTTDLTSWSGKEVQPASSFGVGCRAGLGWFGPYFSAGTVAPVAGASSPFVLRVNKPDGQSALNGIALSLPEGLLGNLKGNIGRQVGTARAAAGVGPNPFWLSGPVVLEGPYGDAPFSLRVTVPAIAGPFNLGDVVVRQKLYVDPHDAHVTVVSDPLPTILQGIPVQLHDLAVDIDKAGFMRNPTSCAAKSIGGTLGAVTGQTAAVASRFQVGDCANLPLAPKMKMDLIGKKETSRGKHPMLSTTLTQQPGESALKQVKVRLPLSLALDPDNAEALCKPEQAAAKACPAASIVGHATAVTPLLDQPLKGDVFFVEGTRKSKQGRTVKTLPKLWVALRGQVAIDLWADSSISQGKYLVTTFGFVPDAPISSFKLDINGGQHGILAVTGDTGANLCKQANVTQATYDGQNGKQVTDNIRMTSPCGFRVQSKSLTKTHAKITLSGLGAGKLSISGKGIHKASRTIKHSDVATIQPRLTESGMRTAKRGKALRLRVTWNPKAKGQKTRHAKAVVKRAKKASSTRAHRAHRTR